MKLHVFQIGVIAIGLSCSSFLSAQTVSKTNEQAIRASVIAFQDAWNQHDMKAMGDVFTEDGDLINVLGTRWRGRAQIVKALGVYHRVMFQKEQIHFHDITVRMITPVVAEAVVVQTGSGEMVLPDGQSTRYFRGREARGNLESGPRPEHDHRRRRAKVRPNQKQLERRDAQIAYNPRQFV